LIELPHHTLAEEVTKDPVSGEGVLQHVAAVVGSRAPISDTSLEILTSCPEVPHLSVGSGDHTMEDEHA
jgi:hypothetical protein